MGSNSEKRTPVLKGVSMSGSLTIVDSQKSCSTLVSKKMFHRKLLRSKTMNEWHDGSRRNWTVRHKLCRRLPLKTMAREQDRFLPIANISRIMKKALPTNAKIAKDAKETVQGMCFRIHQFCYERVSIRDQCFATSSTRTLWISHHPYFQLGQVINANEKRGKQ